MRSCLMVLTASLLLAAACSGSSKPVTSTPTGAAPRGETPFSANTAAPAQRPPSTAAPATAAARGTSAPGASPSASVNAAGASPNPSPRVTGTPSGGASPAAGRTSTPGAASPTVAAKEKPEDALKRQLDFEAKRQYGQEWDELHPLQQQLVPRDKFVQCTSALDLPQIQSVKVNGVTEVPLDLRSVPQKTAQEVSVTITVLDNGTPSDGDQTFDEVQVGDSWRWVLDDDVVNAYKSGQCPS